MTAHSQIVDVAYDKAYDDGFNDCYLKARLAIMGHFQTGNVPLVELQRIADDILIHVVPKKEQP